MPWPWPIIACPACAPVVGGLLLLGRAREQHRTDDGDEQEQAGDLEGQPCVAEEARADLLRVLGNLRDARGRRPQTLLTFGAQFLL
jgi:hypothetical protein